MSMGRCVNIVELQHSILFMFVQVYMMLDALADGGVYAGIPKDIGLKLIAYTMMVTKTSCDQKCH